MTKVYERRKTANQPNPGDTFLLTDMYVSSHSGQCLQLHDESEYQILLFIYYLIS